MKYNLYVNQVKAIELGIKNINMAHTFDLLTTASTWAKPEIVGNKVYYWVARQSICEELALLNMKPDTVYRHFKSLRVLELIEYIKVGKKDCILVTEKGKQYLLKDEKNHYVGNKSEKDKNSEIDPNKLGNRSENNSDLNPTYPTTNSNPTTKIIQEIIDYLNIASHKNFKAANKTTISHINARLKEGYTIDDFKSVISKKVAAWCTDKKMKKFIRPETLFGTKFDSYLQEDVDNGNFSLKDKEYKDGEEF